MNKYCIGIDLGTTNTVVCYINASQPNKYELLKIEGEELIPSIVALDRDNKLIFGNLAKRRSRGFAEFAAYYKLGLYDPEKKYTIGGNTYTAKELTTEFLTYVKVQLFENTDIERDEQILQLVITVPAAFDATSKISTGQAVRDAGFTFFRDEDLIFEPTAALYHHTFKTSDKYIIVYDLGGGTFDCTVMDNETKKPLSSDGSNRLEQLGGKNFDECILAYLEDEQDFTIDKNDIVGYNRVLGQCEELKEALSSDNRTIQKLEIDYKGQNYQLELSREKFEELCTGLVMKTLQTCESALTACNLAFNRISKILLVGGSTKMPIIKKTLKKKFNCEIEKADNINTIVAIGATKHAVARFSGDNPAIRMSLSSHCYSVISKNKEGNKYVNTIMIERNQELPAKSDKVEFKSSSSSAKFYVAETTGSQSTRMKKNDVIEVIPNNHAEISLVQIYTLENIKPPYHLTVQYEYNESGIPNVVVEQEGNDELMLVFKNTTDKSFLDEPILPSPPPPRDEFKIMVTKSGYDNIGSVLSKMKIEYKPYNTNFDCDLLFINCGTGDTISSDKLKSFVEEGGYAYISDLASKYLTTAFPKKFSFKGFGNIGTVEALVVDEELERIIGSKLPITFDMEAWSVLDSISNEGSVILKTSTDGKPLMVMMPIGKGKVFYTCFHNNAQISEKEEKLLKLLVLKQIGAKSNKTLEQMLRIYKI